MSLNSNDEEIILAILRTYPGIYEMQTAFNLQLIAKKSNHQESEILAVLKKLKEKEIIEYHSKNNDATIIFNEVREDERTISRVAKHLENQNELKKEQLQAVVHYINEKSICKNKLILNYFGEKTTVDCGICSFCITKKIKKKDATLLQNQIISLLEMKDLNSRDIQNKTKNNPEEVIFVLQELLEKGSILVKPNNKYTLKK
jgi:ATP-dependent DNA helicase RecQ